MNEAQIRNLISNISTNTKLNIIGINNSFNIFCRVEFSNGNPIITDKIISIRIEAMPGHFTALTAINISEIDSINIL